MKPFIGIKKLWYADPITGDKAFDAAQLVTLLNANTTTSIKNSHNGTFSYEQGDPETTEYINELTGKPYFIDKTSDGAKTIKFTVGNGDLALKAALQGGEYKDGVWEAGTEIPIIYKSVIAQTKTGAFVVFTNAILVAKVDTQEKNLGLGVTATAMDNEDDVLADEYWFEAGKIEYKAGKYAVKAQQ